MKLMRPLNAPVILAGIVLVGAFSVRASDRDSVSVAQAHNDYVARSASALLKQYANAPVNATGFDALGVSLLSQVPLSAFPSSPTSANDIWGYVSPGGREYALVGLNTATGFVDVTDSSTPVVVGDIAHANSFTSDIAQFGPITYVVADGGGGLQMIDLSGIDSGILNLLGSSTSGGFARAHNIYINTESGFAYPCSTNLTGGFVVFDLAVPTAPVVVATWTEASVHDLYVVNYADCPYAGRQGACEIAFTFSVGSGVFIVDVTDKSDMVTIAHHTYDNVRIAHQGWLTEDRRHLLFGDEGDESAFGLTTTTYILNVEDLANPFPVGSFTNGLPSIDHNLAIRGDFALEANYTSGLRIFDISDIGNVVEVGHFDTFPANNLRGFAGAWAAYAALPSGAVLVSDIGGGLFVLDVSEATGCQENSQCSDNNDCTTDTCLEDGTCTNTLVAAGLPCDDGQTCTINGQCDAAGTCVSTDINTIACAGDAVCAPATCDLAAGFCSCFECIAVAAPIRQVSAVAMNRYLPFVTPDNGTEQVAIRVVLGNLPPPFEGFEGTQMWVRSPIEISLVPGKNDTTPPTFLGARLSCTPVVRVWEPGQLIHVFDRAIIPDGTYSIQTTARGCVEAGVSRFSSPLTVDTSLWGDLVGNCAVTPCTPPDDAVNIATDLVAILDTFSGLPTGAGKVRVDIEPGLPNNIVDIVDVTRGQDAFRGFAYPFDGPQGCP